MNISQASLVIVGANTPECKVFWNGAEVPNLGIRVNFDGKVTLRVAEDPVLAEMQSVGIKIERVNL